jgi:hypothetical protein
MSVVPGQVPTADQQIQGVRDDGSAEGIVRAEIRRGNLVVMPFRQGLFTASATGAGSATTGVLPGTAFTNNDESTQTGVLLTVAPNAALGSFAILSHWVTGNIYGLRWDKNLGSQVPQPPFGLFIDGVAYKPNVGNPVHPSTQVAIFSGGFITQIFATDLGEGQHYVEIVFPCALSGANRQYGLLGFVADAAAGYLPIVPSNRWIGRIGGTPTSLVATVAKVIGPPSSTCYGIRKWWIFNPTAGPAVVKIKFAGQTEFWQKTVLAGDTVEFDPGGPFIPLLTFTSDTTGVLVSAAEIT